MLWEGTYDFRPYPKVLESLTVCRYHYKGCTFFSVVLRTLSVGPAGVWTRDLPLSPNWADQEVRQDNENFPPTFLPRARNPPFPVK